MKIKMQPKQINPFGRIFSVFLVISLMITGITVPKDIFAESKDVTALLEPLEIKIDETKLEGTVIDLTGKQQLNLTVSMKVPVSNDFPGESNESKKNKIVKSGDTARIEFSRGLKIFENAGKQDIIRKSQDETKDLKLGEYEFKQQENDDKVYLEIKFTDSGVTGEDIYNAYQNVAAKIFGKFKLILPLGQTVPVEDTNITILGKEYTIKVKKPERKNEIKKDGKVIIPEHNAEWSLKVSSDNEVMTGYTVVDKLSYGATYVSGSFKIKYTPNGATQAVTKEVTPVYDAANRTVSYTFVKEGTDEITSPAEIILKTGIPDDIFMTNGIKWIMNDAELRKEGMQTLTDRRWIQWENDPIIKELVKQEVKDGTYCLQWKLTVNSIKTEIKNAKIIERLDKQLYYSTDTHSPYQLDFDSAEITYYDSDDIKINSKTKKYSKNPVAGEEAFPASEEFELGDIDGKVEMLITAKVTNPAGMLNAGKIVSEFTAKNTAYIAWGNWSYASRTSARTSSFTIGHKGITKRLKDGGSYLNFASEWEIKVNKNSVGADTKVYDVLIFDDTFEVTNYDNLKLETANGADNINGVPLKNLKPKEMSYFKYISASQPNGKTNVNVTTKALYSNDKHVGDIVIMSGFKPLSDNPTDDENTVYLKTRMASRKSILNNNDPESFNTAFLYEAHQYIDHFFVEKKYYSGKLLTKEVMQEASADRFDKNPISANANMTSDNSPELNHVDKTVTYRLAVNGDKVFDLGDCTVTDNLPKALKLEKYTIFKADYDNTSKVFTATGNLVLQGEGDKSNSTVEVKVKEPTGEKGQELTFKFLNIDDTYVIMIKTKMTDVALKEYVEDAGPNKLTNSATVSLSKITGIETPKRENYFSFLLNAIDKKYDFEPTKPTELKWSIDYTPHGLINEDTALIEDVIGENMELRYGKTKNSLNFENGNFRIYEMKLHPNSNRTTETAVTDIQKYLTYDYDSRTLKFKIPDHTKSYRLYYITDLTGKLNSKAVNTARLKYTSVKPKKDTVKEYLITALSANAIATKSAVLEITKKAKDGPILAGAKFNLKSKGETPYYDREFTSDATGKVRFIGMPEGEYALTEKEAPNGYQRVTKEYAVEVKSSGAAFKAKFKGTESNEITIENELKPNATPKNTKPDKPKPENESKPKEPPVTPPDNSEKPPKSEEPPNKPNNEVPKYEKTKIPNPKDPDSPNTIIIIDNNGLPLGKFQKNKKDDGTIEYLMVEEVPLGKGLPKTGDDFAGAYHMGGFSLIVCGLGIALVEIRRRKQSKKI